MQLPTSQAAPQKPQPVRTTISLHPVVHTMGEQIKTDNGFTSFSDMIEFFIRVHSQGTVQKQ